VGGAGALVCPWDPDCGILRGDSPPHLESARRHTLRWWSQNQTPTKIAKLKHNKSRQRRSAVLVPLLPPRENPLKTLDAWEKKRVWAGNRFMSCQKIIPPAHGKVFVFCFGPVPENLLNRANFALKFGSSVVCGHVANSFGGNLIQMEKGKSAVKKAKIDGILLGTRPKK